MILTIMVFKANKLPLFLFFFFLCITSTLALAHHQTETEQDLQREYHRCLQRCQEQKQQPGQQQQQQCQQRCERQRQEQEERHEREHREGRQREQGGGRDPQQEYQQCQRRCQVDPRSPAQGQQQQQQQCQQRCEERRQEQERQQQEYQQCRQRCQQQEQGQGKQQQQQRCQQRCEDERQRQEQRDNAQEKPQEEERNNPYFLDEQSFKERIKTEHGYTRVSRRFSKISNLLRGIENYRLGLFEANPSTFLIPHHLDADAIFVVVQGRGLINLIHQQDRNSYNLERGDVIRVPAGALIYLINRDNNDKFQIVSLLKPVSTPTNKFREFFGVGGENPETFYNTFSDEILEAAFNTDKKGLDSLFRQQRKGGIVQASQEQIRALSQDVSSSRQHSPKWSRHSSQSWRPFNLLNQRPTHSNEYGQLYDVTPNDYPQLQDLDVAVSYHKINKGAMVAPFYNSRATSLVVVVDGDGRFEMACPHLSSSQTQIKEGSETREQEQKQGGSVHYQKVSARLSPRTAFIIPAGHPVSIVASDNQNLEIVAFKVNAENNERNYLAGQNNLLNQLQREAKELAFNKPAREVETILNNQRQSVFLPGPHQHQQREHSEEGRHGGLLSIADVLAF
ncbi:hypothetical protein AQUCO_01100067v1 [Aquilegia coerulea]|uniref:Cupin type-1 domain-containing protein n=1 Tax=Aquilegia coerulea TaxID=218851 RepID=A0A2G5E5G3_AQUCA|nr:hypothetical protein AQUCO_01100067v1 [Aquilegia coerulea]